MDKLEAVLPRIVDRKSWLLKAFIWGGIALLCISVLGFFLERTVPAVILLFISILMLNANYVIKEYDITGSISLLPDKIVVSDHEGIHTYTIPDLSKLEIFLLGVKG